MHPAQYSQRRVISLGATDLQLRPEPHGLFVQLRDLVVLMVGTRRRRRLLQSIAVRGSAVDHHLEREGFVTSGGAVATEAAASAENISFLLRSATLMSKEPLIRGRLRSNAFIFRRLLVLRAS